MNTFFLHIRLITTHKDMYFKQYFRQLKEKNAFTGTVCNRGSYMMTASKI